MTTPEAATILGVTGRAVRQFNDDGVLRGEFVGNGWVFDRAQVERLAADRKQNREDSPDTVKKFPADPTQDRTPEQRRRERINRDLIRFVRRSQQLTAESRQPGQIRAILRDLAKRARRIAARLGTK